jgi:serine/threonine protein kinase
MSEQQRIRALLEEALESGRTPEEVCVGAPELLPRVRALWLRARALGAEIEALFPGTDSASDGEALGGAAAARERVLPHIEGYAIEGVLGRGGMGIVYRARHAQLGRTVALKMLLAGVHADAAESARFLREARALSKLRHPHVVQVYDVGESGGAPFFTMELVEGGNLAQVLRTAPLAVERALTIAIALADGVQAAHASGIVHRDLKPGNILLDLDGTPKIGDFGVARQQDDEGSLTRTGARLGTPSYMAPEQLSGTAAAHAPAVDVHALGVLLYEMLTGAPPFRGEGPVETERRIS